LYTVEQFLQHSQLTLIMNISRWREIQHLYAVGLSYATSPLFGSRSGTRFIVCFHLGLWQTECSSDGQRLGSPDFCVKLISSLQSKILTRQMSELIDIKLFLLPW